MSCGVIEVIFILILLKWFFGAPSLDPIGHSPGIPFNTLGISSRISTVGVMKNCMRNSGRGNNFTREIVNFRPLLRNILFKFTKIREFSSYFKEFQIALISKKKYRGIPSFKGVAQSDLEI